MKSIITSAVVALFLCGEAQAIRMKKEDIDADDMEIQDGPLKDERDVAVFQDSFVNKGDSIKKLNQEAKQQKLDKENAPD